jgi:hypothetical protein
VVIPDHREHPFQSIVITDSDDRERPFQGS